MDMLRKKDKTCRRKYAVLYGFNIDDKDDTGYLALGDNGPRVTKNWLDAARFSLSAEPGKGTPRDWCEFFKGEAALSRWRFHPVTMIDQGEKPKPSRA